MKQIILLTLLVSFISCKKECDTCIKRTSHTISPYQSGYAYTDSIEIELCDDERMPPGALNIYDEADTVGSTIYKRNIIIYCNN